MIKNKNYIDGLINIIPICTGFETPIEYTDPLMFDEILKFGKTPAI
jgi:hypothetical protein